MARSEIPHRTIGGALSPIILWGLLAGLAALLFAWRVGMQQPASVPDDLRHVILFYSSLPRAFVAVLAGAVLGLSGLLLQHVLRNPLAEPSTLGISGGAQLAMTLASLYAPLLMERSQGLVAFAGGTAAVLLVLALTWRRGLEPVSVVLAGMMVALTASSVSAALILANGDYLFSLFIWGGGSLVQQDWQPAIALTIRLAAGAAAALMLLRPLTILGLDDASARGLGVARHTSRFLIIALAVWMATTVAAQIGVIGFVGLAAPALATLSGARTLRQKLVAAPLIGAVLLWLTDGLVQLAAGAGGERIPTGAGTALLGGPLLLWLLPRLRMFEWPHLGSNGAAPRKARRPWLIIFVLLALTFAAAALALVVGRGPAGWSIAGCDLLADLVSWRAPRVGVAAAAGAMLAAAGVVIQRVTGNPLASPEVLGVGTGAGAGLTAVLTVSATAGLGWQLAGSAAGSLAALAAMLAIAAKAKFGADRLLLAGIAMSALCSALITATIAMGNAQSYMLLRWLSGSTGQATALDASVALACLLPLTPPLFLAARWLDILPLGADSARGLGVPVAGGRLMLVVVSALLTALAALIVGPLSFVGLIAPHLARFLGFWRARIHLAGAMLLGALLMTISDWLSRMAAFPYELPVGLFASLLGGPYLVYLLAKGVPRHG
ncbi:MULTISPECIES: Fe(3+)-hydroxamate ABC transporter permease FhuB [unclassified Mesorhizobium]|uniref:Fe(3+)-hydroxamate ABC transporter permease FhuB n=1 Tax=unclassified Mesorhizobium TaxID=325217 RepID=UPI001AEF34A3|nr:MULTISPECIES: Fe(3+)-hydroxamate ABC transporter permease FhuB [unclassified Mesorhizobium]MCA0003944.1 Fe(3+)-hydroxamate ABC transporter permease FhuB [Mesorhizobium sp. B264B2A]MCA0008190.1 Fe(3+)-hydroxamate ABC transporter permease FhuB [Mesorhizobium sp. B264B1B]MCA0021544.1 Fe(3+)-hydroxamate ABC transporter permease FhuB [Mesorhizobium sp. B264B1A]